MVSPNQRPTDNSGRPSAGFATAGDVARKPHSPPLREGQNALLACLPCFAATAYVLTQYGPRAAQGIQVGTPVVTTDSGVRPVVWINHLSPPPGQSPDMIEIASGVFGNPSPICLSPRQHLLLRGWRAEQCCGTHEVLIQAAHLENGHSIRRRTIPPDMRFVLILLGRADVIQADGLELLTPDPTLPDLDATARQILRDVALSPDTIEDRLGPLPPRRIARPDQARAITGYWPVIW